MTETAGKNLMWLNQAGGTTNRSSTPFGGFDRMGRIRTGP
jgi:hypothetical protein